MMVGKNIIKQARLVEKAIIEINNLRLSKFISRVSLNESVYYVILNFSSWREF